MTPLNEPEMGSLAGAVITGAGKGSHRDSAIGAAQAPTSFVRPGSSSRPKAPSRLRLQPCVPW